MLYFRVITTNVYGVSTMDKQKNFFIIEADVLPEIFLKVVEAKKLMESGKVKTVQDATKQLGISRSAYYKYKDAIYPLYDNYRGRTITMAMSLMNEAGILSNILNVLAEEEVNVLTINSNIPINNVANATITIETAKLQKQLTELVSKIEQIEGVLNFKIIARE